MKILALEKELKTVDWEKESLILVEEAKAVYEMLLTGSLREIYFTENKNAVIMLECESIIEAKHLLDSLPLVQKGIIAFEIMELHPYTGFTRLINIK
jgi:hypothetical protein